MSVDGRDASKIPRGGFTEASAMRRAAPRSLELCCPVRDRESGTGEAKSNCIVELGVILAPMNFCLIRESARDLSKIDLPLEVASCT